MFISTVAFTLAEEHEFSGYDRLNCITRSVFKLAGTPSAGSTEFDDQIRGILRHHKSPYSFVAWLLERVDITGKPVWISYDTGSLVILFIVADSELYISKISVETLPDHTLALNYTRQFTLPYQMPLDQIETVTEEEVKRIQRSAEVKIPK